MLRVRELVKRLKDLPDQDAVVLIGEGTEPGVSLVVTSSDGYAFRNMRRIVRGSVPRSVRRLSNMDTLRQPCARIGIVRFLNAHP